MSQRNQFPPIEYICTDAEDHVDHGGFDDDSITIYTVASDTLSSKGLLEQAGRRFDLLQSRWESERLLRERDLDDSPSAMIASEKLGQEYASNGEEREERHCNAHGPKCPNRKASLKVEISAYETNVWPKCKHAGPKCPHRRASLVLSVPTYDATAQTMNKMVSVKETRCGSPDKAGPCCPKRKRSIVLQESQEEGHESEKETQRVSTLPKRPSRRRSTASLGTLADLGSLVLSLASQDISEKLETKQSGVMIEAHKYSIPSCPCRRPSIASINRVFLDAEADSCMGGSTTSSEKEYVHDGKAPSKPLRRISIMLSLSGYENFSTEEEEILNSVKHARGSSSTLPPKRPCRKGSMNTCRPAEESDEESVETKTSGMLLSEEGRHSAGAIDLLLFS